jgi:hypothetical protein
MSTKLLALSCPVCGKKLTHAILHSSGIVVCSEEYLAAMWALQEKADRGWGANVHAGWSEHIIPMYPFEQKYAACYYCEQCKLAVVLQRDLIPSDEIPDIAK